jgi:hypothetical protein
MALGAHGIAESKHHFLLSCLVLSSCPALCKHLAYFPATLTTADRLSQSFSLFLPTIIRALGYTATTAQLFTVPPNLTAFFLVLITAGFSDRLKARGPFMLGGCVLAIIGYSMLIVSKRPAISYGGTFFVAAGVFPGEQLSLAGN